MTDKVDLPGGIYGRASAPAAEEHPHMFGLTLAMALIAGSIIGVGIFNLPTSLVTYGPIRLASMTLTTVGALALLFASLSRLLRADRGRCAYARVAFGTASGSPTPGRTGSRPGRATPRSPSGGCCRWSTSQQGPQQVHLRADVHGHHLGP